MDWKKKLTKKELLHVKETCNRITLGAIKRNLSWQKESEIKCWDCRAIARKLGIEL